MLPPHPFTTRKRVSIVPNITDNMSSLVEGRILDVITASFVVAMLKWQLWIGFETRSQELQIINSPIYACCLWFVKFVELQ
jgi:hypothetical protein